MRQTSKFQSALIETKVVRPPLLKGMVDRAGARLGEEPNRRLILVSAPAGFGKTTLVSQWLEGRVPLSTGKAWLSIDEADNDLWRFVRYLVAAIQRAVSFSASNIEGLLDGPGSAPYRVMAEALVADLDSVDESVIVVLDDLHLVSLAPIHSLLQAVVEQLPTRVQFVALTRQDPPWPLARWRVRGWLRELRLEDLCFSVDEARQFFKSESLSDEAIRQLVSETEGWAAGLRMIQLAMEQGRHAERQADAISCGDRLFDEYMVAEVLNAQPAEVREFLSLTAPLDRFSAPLCDRLLADRPDAPRSLERIEDLMHRNLFIVPLGNEGLWYRYHHRFRQLLIERLVSQPSPFDPEEIWRRAGEWFADQGLVEEGLRYLIKAGEIDAASSLLREHLHESILDDPSRHLLSSWLAMFPQGSERGRPSLLAAQAYSLITHSDLRGIAERLSEIQPLLSDEHSPCASSEELAEIRVDVDALSGFLLFWSGDPEGALRHAQRAVASASGRQTFARTLGYLYTGLGLVVDGREEEALRLLDDAVQSDVADGGERVSELLGIAAICRASVSDIDGARACCEMILELHRQKPFPDYFLGLVIHVLGVAAYERNELRDAARHFDELVRLCHRTNSRFCHDAMIGLSRIALAKGDLLGAQKHASAARAFAIEACDPMSIPRSVSHEARLEALKGRLPANIPEGSEIDVISIYLEDPRLTYAELRLTSAAPDCLQTYLADVDESLKYAERRHNVRAAIQLSALRAIALTESGQPVAGFELLEESLRRAAPLRLVRTFVDIGKSLKRMLQTLAERNPGDEYVHCLLEAFERDGVDTEPEGRVPSAERRTACHPEDLSNREIDVLILLAERLSNKEIGARLFVSPETVKKHTLAIYRKLGVHRRREAVAAAAAQGMIDRRGP